MFVIQRAWVWVCVMHVCEDGRVLLLHSPVYEQCSRSVFRCMNMCVSSSFSLLWIALCSLNCSLAMLHREKWRLLLLLTCRLIACLFACMHANVCVFVCVCALWIDGWHVCCCPSKTKKKKVNGKQITPRPPILAGWLYMFLCPVCCVACFCMFTRMYVHVSVCERDKKGGTADRKETAHGEGVLRMQHALQVPASLWHLYGSLLGQTCLMPWLPTYAAWDTLYTVLHCPAQSRSDDNTVSWVSGWILWAMQCTEVYLSAWTSSSSLNETAEAHSLKPVLCSGINLRRKQSPKTKKKKKSGDLIRDTFN